DLAAAAEGIGGAGYFNAGQDCTAATRVLVHEDVHDEFVAELVAWARTNAATGAPNEDVYFGALNNANQFERVSGVIDALPGNANVELGGKRQGSKGYFYEASVITGLEQTDDAIQNEIFGPVITVQKVSSEAQALEWAN